ncbi:MAG TPA: hypothetical protein VH229_01360, partial [Candidatus Udaeobacter sp.]|nr:hypothetical protein [Candidatus Udaeobacter sp.]
MSTNATTASGSGNATASGSGSNTAGTNATGNAPNVSNPVATFNAKAYQKFELPYFHGGNDTSDFAHWKHRVKRALLINDLF